MCHVLRLPLFTAATAKRLESNSLFPSFKLGNNNAGQINARLTVLGAFPLKHISNAIHKKPLEPEVFPHFSLTCGRSAVKVMIPFA